MTAADNDEATVPGARVKGSAPDLGLPPEACLFEGSLDPCTVIIFGATGPPAILPPAS